MFIQTEETPNPNSLKFLPGVKISPIKSVSYDSQENCSDSPLARALLKIAHVEQVFFGENFITISKKHDKNWDIIKPQVMLTIVEHFSSNLPIFIASKVQSTASSLEENDDPIVAQIKEIIEHRVRPAVAQDGGDIIFHSFKDGVVKLELYGACSGCPSSQVTLKQGIETMLKHYIPEVESVEAIN